MQKWPYADIAYINVEHFRSTSKKNDPPQKREYLTVEAVFGSENAVMLYSPQMSDPQKIIKLPRLIALCTIFGLHKKPASSYRFMIKIGRC